MPSHTRFKSVNSIGEALLSEQLECNLTEWVRWGLLEIGAFSSTSRSASGAYHGYDYKLRPLKDPRYLNGQVWQGFRKDWIFESGLEYGYQPIQISGVWVNGNFYPSNTTGTYEHYIDYPNGRVVFTTPVATTGTVECEFSYRYVSVSPPTPWFREFQRDTLRSDNPQFSLWASGTYAVLPENRVQLPAVIVEATTRSSRVGLGLGDLSTVVRQDVLFHLFSEEPDGAKKLSDILTSQWQKRIYAFDKNITPAPLDERGSPATPSLTYPDMVAPTGDGGYRWTQLRLVGMQGFETPQKIPFYSAVVRATVEVDLA